MTGKDPTTALRSFLQRPANESVVPHAGVLYEALEAIESEQGESFPIGEYTTDYLIRLLDRYDPLDFLNEETADQYLRWLAEQVLDYYDLYASQPDQE